MHTFLSVKVPSFFLLLLSLSFFYSCSDSEPQLAGATGSVVFDYADGTSQPAVKLSVFTMTASEVRRASKISVTARKNGYQWTVDSPRLISSEGRQWAGYTNLEPVTGETIPTGTYDLIYTDAAGREINTTFSVDYPDALMTSTADSVKTILTVPLEEYTALYDDAGQLLFFDKAKNTWNDVQSIRRDYPDAVAERKCLETLDQRIICIMPPKQLAEEKTNNMTGKN